MNLRIFLISLAFVIGIAGGRTARADDAVEQSTGERFETAVDQLALDPSDREPAHRVAAGSILDSIAERSGDEVHNNEAVTNVQDGAREEDGDQDAGSLVAPSRVEVDPRYHPLRDRIRRVLGTFHQRHLNTNEHNPWEMMHALISYGVHTNIRRGGSRGEIVNAASYLCWNGPCHGLTLLEIDRGRVNARKGPYVQGHYGQLLALLAQSHVKPSYPLRVGDKTFTLKDLIETEKLTCRTGEELTFKLISLAHYLDSDAEWGKRSG